MTIRHGSAMRAFACVALLAGLSTATAQDTRLAAQQDRIVDSVIQADLDAYASIQRRIKALNEGGRRVADYHSSKAQCWLDTSFHEYTRNDRSEYPQAALTESERLVVAMERDQTALPMETPLVNGAARLRPDLWSRIETVKGKTGLRCAAQKVACAEVELVHAGNEDNQLGWRHARPYVQIAEDLVGDAETLAGRCDPEPAAPVASVPAPPLREELVTTHVEFRFDRDGRADIVPSSLDQFDALSTRMRESGVRVESVRLVGHADRLNGTGNAAYNQRLSERRNETVRALLVERGIDARVIESRAVGAADPIAACDRAHRDEDALRACLLPNRRVDVEVRLRR